MTSGAIDQKFGLKPIIRAGSLAGALLTLLPACGPSFESLRGLPLRLEASELSKVTIRQSFTGTDSNTPQGCQGPEELKLEEGVRRVTISGCDPEGRPQMETFRLTAASHRKLQAQVEALPLKRLPVPLREACPPPGSGRTGLLVIARENGEEMLFAPSSLPLSPASGCETPLSIDGVFDDDRLAELIDTLHGLAGKKS